MNKPTELDISKQYQDLTIEEKENFITWYKEQYSGFSPYNPAAAYESHQVQWGVDMWWWKK